VRRFKPWTLPLAVWGAVWLAVGEALHRGAGWDRTLSTFIAIAVASAVPGLIERAAQPARSRSSDDERPLATRPRQGSRPRRFRHPHA
jgi:hypothetical protein